MLNTATLHGRFTATPELKKTTSGRAVTSFTLAVPRDYKTKNGDEIVDFINCVAWEQTAEFAAKYFEKGSPAIVRGSIEVRKYKDKNGNNRNVTEIKVDRLYFAETKKQDSNGGEYTPPDMGYKDIPEDYDGDDLPF